MARRPRPTRSPSQPHCPADGEGVPETDGEQSVQQVIYSIRGCTTSWRRPRGRSWWVDRLWGALVGAASQQAVAAMFAGFPVSVVDRPAPSSHYSSCF